MAERRIFREEYENARDLMHFCKFFFYLGIVVELILLYHVLSNFGLPLLIVCIGFVGLVVTFFFRAKQNEKICQQYWRQEF